MTTSDCNGLIGPVTLKCETGDLLHDLESHFLHVYNPNSRKYQKQFAIYPQQHFNLTMAYIFIFILKKQSIIHVGWVKPEAHQTGNKNVKQE